MQLALGIRRARQRHLRRAPPLPCDARVDSRIRRLFPFTLTDDQNKVVAEISADLAQEVPMNRLLQGDVGSGKTVVAEYAMLLTVAHGYQSVLMAPTEILARQHSRTLAKNLEQSRVRIALLIGSLTPSLRRETLARIAAGEIDLVVGTHSILQEDVQFSKLGLVIIDEQHKFGVMQRAKLKRSGLDPHYLVMTATPIPRTVSMTLFGDLDTSVLRTPPPGRQGAQTYLGNNQLRERWWEFFRKQLRAGRQGYVVTPLVDDSENVLAASVEQAFEALSNGELEAFRLGLVHGRQTPAEKEAAMESFRTGVTQVLVATSVVEVGVDVPNATVMTIENGERFGLAQLHQLRGRISRGVHAGHLCVFAESESEEAQERLKAFCSTNDGFELAELDFKLRGPGDLFSIRQHGLPPLRIADVLRDSGLLEEARKDAQAITSMDAELTAPEYAKLRRMVMSRYGEALELGDVG
jgi:ATP-dependent DNA helicase RecG